MSRIGKKPVEFSADIKVSSNGDVITFAKGKLTMDLDTKGNVDFTIAENTLTFATKSDDKAHRAFWGTYRALSQNIVVGFRSKKTNS